MPFTLKNLFASCLLVVMQTGFAQVKELPRGPICYTRVADSGYYMKNAQEFLERSLREKQMNPNAVNFSAPYTIRVFIRIVRQDNGTLPGCTIETAVENFNEMNAQYNGHNICFQLVGIDFVNDTYLNNFNIKDSLDGVYPAYIRNNNLDVNGAMTIFVHYNFLNNTGSSGNAYGIPNNFLSVARWAANSTDVRSIFGHEMGHCLGLYHTHEQYNGSQENVTRSGSNSCYNCPIEGDLCCDTPADYANSDNYTNSSTCVYSRNFDNNCDDLQYNPSTINIMSYHPWTCISSTSTALTSNQRTRMHATINDVSGPVNSRVAEDNFVLNSITRSTDAVRIYTAKFDVTTANGAAISHTADSKAYYTAGSSITFSPGVFLSPGVNGVALASISGCN